MSVIMDEVQQGYYTLTYRFRLLDGDEQMLWKTKELYNQIVAFYLDVYFEDLSLGEIPKGQLLRAMEKLTIPGRDYGDSAVRFPFGKVPAYFRRAAMNSAITAAKQLEARGQQWTGKNLNMAPVFYKGMYRDLSDKEVELKLWDGKNWSWNQQKLRGRPWPEEGRQMSPTLILDDMNRHPMLHVPVQMMTPDTRSIRQKMKTCVGVCGVCFNNEDTFAVCGIVRRDGSFGRCVFCRGGRQYRRLCQKTLEKIYRSKQAVGCYGKSNDRSLNRRYWNYLKHLTDFYAHQASCQIISFCQENSIQVLALPEYEEKYESYVLAKAGRWSPLYLGIRIRKLLEYKAWGAGISIAKVKYYRSWDEKAEGSGNRHLGTARKIGVQCLVNHGVLRKSEAAEQSG